MPKISFTTDELQIIRDVLSLGTNNRVLFDVKNEYGFEKVRKAFAKLGLK